MAQVPRISTMRRRFNELAAAVGQARELARAAQADTQALREDLARVSAAQTRLEMQFERIAGVLESLDERQRADQELAQTFRTDVIRGLRRVHAEEAWHRRRLRELRETESYDQAFTDPEPLISVLIPTYDRLDLLRSRAIPSVLAQEYRNFEIVIVGDGAPFNAEDVLEGFDGAPIRYINLAMPGQYPEDRRRRWLVAGNPPFNEAMYLAQGAWIVPFADDDSLRPHHMRILLDRARRDRLEFVYGGLQEHPSGQVLGSFPPRLGDIGLQASLIHGHLSFFELELADADFDIPGDWGRIERMLRAGVRVAMIDDVVADYFPSMRGFESEPR